MTSAFERGRQRARAIISTKAAGIDVHRRALQLRRRPVPQTGRPPLASLLSTVMSFRVTSEDRLAVLRAVLARFEQAMSESGVAVHVTDASDPPLSDAVRALFDGSGLTVSYRNAPERLTEAYLRMLRSLDREFFLLQFDDQLTAGLQPEFLAAACELLARYQGQVDVVSVLWPWSVSVRHESRTIDVVTHRVRPHRFRHRSSYSFGRTPFRTPVVIDQVGRYRFGIFENLTYGFYFNHLVSRCDDYAARLDWYMKHVSTDAHQIELVASSGRVGPGWKHIALCLDDLALLDLDFEHTHVAVRPEGRENRAVFEAVAAGYGVCTRHVDAELNPPGAAAAWRS